MMPDQNSCQMQSAKSIIKKVKATDNYSDLENIQQGDVLGMAINTDGEKSMIAGFFSDMKYDKGENKKGKKTGRPRDSDLKENEAVLPTTVQLTEETQFLVDSYALNHKGMSRSQIIRELIRKYISDL